MVKASFFQKPSKEKGYSVSYSVPCHSSQSVFWGDKWPIYEYTYGYGLVEGLKTYVQCLPDWLFYTIALLNFTPYSFSLTFMCCSHPLFCLLHSTFFRLLYHLSSHLYSFSLLLCNLSSFLHFFGTFPSYLFFSSFYMRRFPKTQNQVPFNMTRVSQQASYMVFTKQRSSP